MKKRNRRISFVAKYFLPTFSLYMFWLMLDLWKNYSPIAQDIFKNNIAPFFDHSVPLIMFLLVVYYVGITIRDIYKHRLEEQEIVLNSEIHKLVLLNQRFDILQKMDLLKQTLRDFVESQRYVQSIQIYAYEVKTIGSNTRIKVNYEEGHSAEEVEINAMDQSYFYCDKTIHTLFTRAKEAMDKHGHFHLMLQFIRTTVPSLLYLNEITDNDALKYAYVDLGLELLRKYYLLPDEMVIFSPEQKKMFEEQKRTGILRSILLKNNYFLFFNSALGMKQGRVYLARHIDLWGKRYVCLITFHPDVVVDNTEDCDIENVDKKIIDSLLKLQYNVAKGVDERG